MTTATYDELSMTIWFACDDDTSW